MESLVNAWYVKIKWVAVTNSMFMTFSHGRV